MAEPVITIGRHIIEQERRYPEATGAFSDILLDIAIAAKIISREINRAGLVDIVGSAGKLNVHGEDVRKLDEFADEVIFNALDHSGNLCVMASEEVEDPIPIPEKFPCGNYALLHDPLDGSSNIEANVSLGTIFSIHRRISNGERGGMEDLLQPGVRQVAAGYVVYGSSTMLVYTTGAGVHGFTLEPSIGEFLLSHPSMKIPDPGKKIYSVNEAYYKRWSPGQQRAVDELKDDGFSLRYIGSLVADFHRTLLYGGVFMYPADSANPTGKLRLLYEAAPLAMVIGEAGGASSDGHGSILDIEPQELHQRTPLYLGNRHLIEKAEAAIRSDG
ncbi:MAG: class 1 fructose-bisphosphatase [Gemmatimonadetes bacterium]|nr:class 1 fructose-bisphosphatase [Gemmatimonadota bacterium]NIO31200.1 class 1 fructose-bisphosphatase [Gemmatimonadota bacterium]